MDSHREQLPVAVTEDLEVRKESGLNRVADQIRRAFLQVEGVVDSPYFPGPVRYTDENCPAGGVGEGRDGAQEAAGRRQVPLELQGFPLGPSEYVGEVHAILSWLVAPRSAFPWLASRDRRLPAWLFATRILGNIL